MANSNVETIFESDLLLISVGGEYDSVNLFNSKEFIFHQNSAQEKETVIFKLKSKSTNKFIAQLLFSRNLMSYTWYSPVTGAFGPVDLSSHIKVADVEMLIKHALQHLKKNYSAKFVSWRLPPLYKSNYGVSKVVNILYRSGWNITSSDLNYHFDLMSLECFKRNLNSSKRRELNKISRTNVSFEQSSDIGMHKIIYDLIENNRASQGYPMTMSWESIKNLFLAVKERVKFFYIHRDRVMLAAAICLSLNEDVFYVFYWGESPNFRNESPVVKLAEYLYEYCLLNNYKVLDIGTSTDNSIPNQGLVDFKEKIGCLESTKLTMQIAI